MLLLKREEKLSIAKTRKRAMRLIFRNVEGKVPRHAQGDSQHVAIHHSHPRRPQTDRIGECRFATAVGNSQKDAVASEAPAPGSTVLDRADEDLETMENSTRRRTTGSGAICGRDKQ